MTRWSLRRRRPRTGNADPDTSRPDASWPDAHRPDHAHRPSDAAAPQGYPPAGAGAYQLPSVWPEICDQFGLHLLALAEQVRVPLDELEADEADPERLQRLYRIDHAVTRMRRASRDLRTLAGRAGEELEGPVTSLLDVIRMALSAIERYTQVSIAKVADLAVLGYAADDVGSLMATLLDNATRYSPGPVTVSAHLTGDGSVLFRVEDTGIGMAPDTVAGINAMLSGPVREIDKRTGLRTGFPVVHRIARKHQIGVRIATRPSPASGTIAMVTLPVQLLCEIPDLASGGPVPAPTPQPPAEGVTVLPSAARRKPTAAEQPEPSQRSDGAEPADEAERSADEPAPAGGLPRRERASLRGASLRGDNPKRDNPKRDSADGADSEASPALSAEAQADARRAFADDITAFSLGSEESTSLGSQESTGKGTAP